MSSFVRSLDPRLYIAATIGWAVFGVVTLAALFAAELASNQAERRARADAEGLLVEVATQVRDALSMGLEARRSLLQATAAQIASAPDRDPATLRRSLLAAQSEFPEFRWLGVADDAGRILADTGADAGPWSPGADVSTLPWFREGRQAAVVSDIHASPAVPERAPGGEPTPEPRLMDAAVPLRDGGVLGAHLSWVWVERQVGHMRQALSRSSQVELLLAARDGTVLVGPPHWVGRALAQDRDATEAGSYVIGSRTQLRLADGLGLGWTVVVRQRAELALATARTTRRTVFLTVFVAGLLAAAIAVVATRLLTRRLTRLAADAEAVAHGESASLTAPSGADEVGRIGTTLSQMVDRLQAEKEALRALNADLDRRVAERTLRIERMADEARLAAVTRERLRIARDLHDTLAHSLMALLTQLRVVRKLGGRMDAAQLDEELGRAEEVAAAGLSGSRAAIAQMRDNGVRDTGLGAAVEDLVRRFGQRTGVAVAFEADKVVARSTDERAETVFRIIEEALRNVERHAGAVGVRVGLLCRPAGGDRTEVAIEVADDGIGFDPKLSRPGHYGLLGIHEQAALIGARLAVLSAPGQGTRVKLAFEA